MSRLGLALLAGSIILGAFLGVHDRVAPAEVSLDQVAQALASPSFPSLDAGKIGRIEHALKVEPSNPDRWADPGEAYALAGKLPNARRCVQTAARLGSHLTPVLLRCAAFYARIGENGEALPF
jgi:cytochrome c-type biogenesis protein CcmH/NrfG